MLCKCIWKRKTQTGQDGNEKPYLSDSTRPSVDEGAGSSNSPRTRQSRRTGTACFPAYPASFLRHASSGKWSGSAYYSGDAGSCRYFNYPDLYAFGAAAAELDSSPLSSQRIVTLIHHSFPCRVFSRPPNHIIII